MTTVGADGTAHFAIFIKLLQETDHDCAATPSSTRWLASVLHSCAAHSMGQVGAAQVTSCRTRFGAHAPEPVCAIGAVVKSASRDDDLPSRLAILPDPRDRRRKCYPFVRVLGLLRGHVRGLALPQRSGSGLEALRSTPCPGTAPRPCSLHRSHRDDPPDDQPGVQVVSPTCWGRSVRRRHPGGGWQERPGLAPRRRSRRASARRHDR